LCSPVVRSLSLQLNAEIHFLTKIEYLDLVKFNPYITKVHTIKNDVTEIIPSLKELGFDHLIDLHKNWRSQKVRRGLNIRSTSYNKRSLDRWLLVHLKLDRLNNEHIVDRYFYAVNALNVKNDNQGLGY